MRWWYPDYKDSDDDDQDDRMMKMRLSIVDDYNYLMIRWLWWFDDADWLKWSDDWWWWWLMMVMIDDGNDDDKCCGEHGFCTFEEKIWQLGMYF